MFRSIQTGLRRVVRAIFRFGRWHWVGLALIVIAHAFRLTEPIDVMLEDGLLRLRARVVEPPRAGVLLVEAETTERLELVVSSISGFEPAGVIVVTSSEREEGDLRSLDTDVPLVIAREVPAGREVAPLTAEALDGSRVGPRMDAWSLTGGTEGGGLSRCQIAAAEVSGERRLGLEVAALAMTGREVELPTGECFGIAFHGGARSLPKVSAERVVEGGLVRDLVLGRWVLVGGSRVDALRDVATPTTREGERMSLLEFQGQALDTLLRGTVPSRMPLWAVIGTLLGIGAVAIWGERRVRTRWLNWFSALLIVLLIGLGLVFLLLASVRPPWVASMAWVAILYATMLQGRLRRGGRAISELAQELLSRLAPRLVPEGYLGENPWPTVLDGVRTGLGADRVLLFGLGPSGELHGLHGVGCPVDDVKFTHIDRSPSAFRRALESGTPAQPSKPILPVRKGERQGVVPLVFAGERVGLLLWSAAEERAADASWDRILRDFGLQVAEALYHRRRMGEAVTRDASGFAVRQGVGEAFTTLDWMVGLLERRLARFETLLRALGSSVAVFDLLGRAVDVTDSMSVRLTVDRIRPRQLSAADLVTRLTRMSTEEAHESIQRVVATRRPQTLPAYLGGEDGPSTFVILSAIVAPASNGEGQDDSDRRGRAVVGVSFELLETSSIQVLSEVKGQLTKRLGEQLTRDLGEMRAALELLRSGEGGAEIREQILSIVDAKMSSLTELLAESRQYLAIDFEEMGKSRYPIDLRTSLERTLDEHRDSAERRGVELAAEFPEHVGQVLASSVALEEGCGAVLDFLLEDAESTAPLKVRVLENDDLTQIAFSNRGSGHMREELIEILENGRDSERPLDRALATFAEQVALWGGRLNASSHIGVGTRLELELARSKHL